jgi:LPS-assembly lipoprotein
MFRTYRLLAAVPLVITLVLAGCGFHLRGSFNLPPTLTALTVDGREPYSPLLVQTRELLKSAGVATPDNAPYTLYVSEENQGKDRFTQNQNPLFDEFMLTHTATFELRRRDGTLITEPDEVGEMTLFQDDRSTASTKLNEENILRAELAQRLAVKILRRIQAVKPAQWEAATVSGNSGVTTDQLDGALPAADPSTAAPATESPDAPAP